MKYLLLVLSMLTLLPFQGVSAQSSAAPNGWEELEIAISNQPVSQMEDLEGRTFEIEFERSSGVTGFEVFPAEAFSVSRSDGKFRVQIVDAEKLYRSDSGLLFKNDISWNAVIGGAEGFGIAITGLDQCVFNLSFEQSGGDILDLSALQGSFDVSWEESQSGILEKVALNGNSLQAFRKDNDNRAVSVSLILKSKASGSIYRSAPVPISNCGGTTTEPDLDNRILQARLPSQCIVVPRDNKVIETHTVSYRTIMVNTCEKSVRCEVRWEMVGFQSRQAYEQGAQGYVIDSETKSILIGGQSEKEINFSLDRQSSYYTYHFWSNRLYADGMAEGWNTEDFKCDWA